MQFQHKKNLIKCTHHRYILPGFLLVLPALPGESPLKGDSPGRLAINSKFIKSFLLTVPQRYQFPQWYCAC